MARSFTLRTIGLTFVGLAGLMAFSPGVLAQTQSPKPLPPEITSQVSTALTLLSITLGVLEVRMEQQQMVLEEASQQLGIVANQLTVLQNPALLDTEAERQVVSQMLNIDIQVVGLIKSQVNLVNQERSNQLGALSQLTQKFQSLTQTIIQWRAST